MCTSPAKSAAANATTPKLSLCVTKAFPFPIFSISPSKKLSKSWKIFRRSRSSSKLSRELSKRQTGRTLYILDEPTTGLHFDDVKKLLDVLNRLVTLGNTVLI